jgi:hypothetical protein
MAKRVHTDDQVTAFMRELEKQTDRGVGIVAASVAESALTELIKRRLVAMSNTRADLLFGRMRPLSSFSAKIELGAALGLFDERTRTVLNMLRDVRNAFAHEMAAISFDDNEITKLVHKAKMPSTPKSSSSRDTFVTLSYAVLCFFYGIAAADVRIKPLSETHADVFSAMVDALLALARQQAANPK